MWAPDPSWRALAGAGPGTAGLWLADRGGRRWVVKRLTAPRGDEPERLDPTGAGYWRREVEVALDPVQVRGPGLLPPRFGAVEEDGSGATVWAEEVPGPPPTALLVARSLGRYAAGRFDAPTWASRDLLGDRIRMAERRQGWPTLERTPLADVADRLWSRRGHWLDRARAGPAGRVHGDAAPGNFPAFREGEVVALDWQCFGVGPVGADLGYYALSCREEFEVLLDTFLAGYAAEGGAGDPETIRIAATVTAAYTVLSRTEWALAQAARGEGALGGKLRHPAVAVHVRALQRQYAQLEQLL